MARRIDNRERLQTEEPGEGFLPGLCKLRATEASPWEQCIMGLSRLAGHTPATDGCGFFSWIRVVEEEVR